MMSNSVNRLFPDKADTIAAAPLASILLSSMYRVSKAQFGCFKHVAKKSHPAEVVLEYVTLSMFKQRNDLLDSRANARQNKTPSEILEV